LADFTSRASLAGAVDLSSLRAKNEPQQPSTAPSKIAVPDLVALGTEENLKNFLTISNSVAVVIEFFTAGSEGLAGSLEKHVRDLAGKVLLVRIDGDASPRILQAFGVQNLPSVAALLKGQPVPLFEGDQADDAINAVLTKLTQVAAENGITGMLEISENDDSTVQPPAPVKHVAAYEAMESADYAAAVSLFEAALVHSPADQEAQTGLAQAKLLLRTQNLDFEKTLTSTVDSTEALLQKADACVAVGHAAEGYQLILTRFATAEKEEREILRKHLLELFAVSDPSAPELANARRVLASLLY
jgi:putative thioredoxin